MNNTPARENPLEALPHIRHAFFTRNDGVSDGLYQSNNCAFGSRDKVERIQQNRAASMSRLGMSALVTARQEHTADVVEVTEAWDHDAAPVADALVTRTQDIALGILTADCAPVLLADSNSSVIAAAHAGWKGACAGVLENAVDAMISLGAELDHIIAVVGPCISQISYEVGPEFVARFREIDDDFGQYFTAAKSNGHAHFDLASFAADRLRQRGVPIIATQDDDTCANEELYFSYRRSVLRGEPDYGRQLSAIGLKVS